MRRMTDTELRIVLIINRQTQGWVVNKETGERKIEDWISASQLIKKTGRSNRSVSSAITTCIKNKWIEARDKEGNILDTPEKRSGNKILYRLGPMFFETQTSEVTSRIKSKPVKNVHSTSEDISLQPVKNLHSTKETLIKETNTKSIGADAPVETSSKKTLVKKPKESEVEVNEAIKVLSSLNPDWNSWYRPGPMRASVKKLVKFTKDDGNDLTELVQKIVASRGKEFEVQIHNPCDFVQKYSKLITKKKKSGGLSSENVVTPGRYNDVFKQQRELKAKKEEEYRLKKLQANKK